MLIYKILTRAQWDQFRRTGSFTGAPVDVSDGYIHFSTAPQLRETAARHFAGQSDLELVWADGDALGDALKWEISRGGAKFPHLYAHWSLDDMLGHTDLPLVGDAHLFAEEIP